MNKKKIAISLMMILGTVGSAAQAAMLQTGDLLTITNGVPAYDSNANQVNVSSGSYFAIEIDPVNRLRSVSKTQLVAGTDGGIQIGVTQPPGAIGTGASWATMQDHYTTAPVTGGTTNGLTFNGWAVNWPDYGISSPMGSGAWTPTTCAAQGVPCSGYSDGVALFSWNGVYGDAYTLNYSSTFQLNDPSGFGGVHYFVHLEGFVSAAPSVPVPAAAWLFGSGLLGLMGVIRRKTA